MKVFVFGAGASKGAQSITLDKQYQAPLANELFAPQYQDYAVQTLLTPDVMEQYRLESDNVGSVEKWLTQKWDKINSYQSSSKIRRERSSFGHITFYVWRLLQQISSVRQANSYEVFISKLTNSDRDEDFGLVSFNYDTMLDQAVINYCKTPLINLDSYKKVNYIKPHGSINWFIKPRNIDPPVPRERNFDLATRINLAAEHMFNGPPLSLNNMEILSPTNPDLMNQKHLDQLFMMFDNKYFYPLVLVPLLSKLYSHIEDLNELIMSEGKRLMSKASEIYFIGYQGADDIIFEMLQEAKWNTPLHVIGRNAESVDLIMNNVINHQSVKGLLKEGKKFSNGFDSFSHSTDY